MAGLARVALSASQHLYSLARLAQAGARRLQRTSHGYRNLGHHHVLHFVQEQDLTFFCRKAVQQSKPARVCFHHDSRDEKIVSELFASATLKLNLFWTDINKPTWNLIGRTSSVTNLEHQR